MSKDTCMVSIFSSTSTYAYWKGIIKDELHILGCNTILYNSNGIPSKLQNQPTIFVTTNNP